MSDNYDNDQVDFEEEDRNGDDNQQNDHDNFSEDRSRSDYRERHQDQRDTYDNRDEGSENHQDLDNHDVDGNKIIKPRTDGGIGVSVNGYIPNVIFISRFAPGMGKGELENFMSKFGAITEVSIKGAIAFVEFERAEDATTAKHTCHMHSGLGADTLVVDFKRDQYVPSRKNTRDNFNGSFDRGGRGGRFPQSGGRQNAYYSNDQNGYNNFRGDGGRGGGRGGFRQNNYNDNSYYSQQQNHINGGLQQRGAFHEPRFQQQLPPQQYLQGDDDFQPTHPVRVVAAPVGAESDSGGVPVVDDFHAGGAVGGRGGGRGRGDGYYPPSGGRGYSRPYDENRGYQQQVVPVQYEPNAYHSGGGGNFQGRGGRGGGGRGGDFQQFNGRGGGRGGYDQRQPSFAPLQAPRQPYAMTSGPRDEDYGAPLAQVEGDFHQAPLQQQRQSAYSQQQYQGPPQQQQQQYGQGYSQQQGRGGGGRFHSNGGGRGGGGGRYYSHSEDARPTKTLRYEEQPEYAVTQSQQQGQAQSPYAPQQQQQQQIRPVSSHHNAYTTSNRQPQYQETYGPSGGASHYEELGGGYGGGGGGGQQQQQYSSYQPQQQSARSAPPAAAGGGRGYEEVSLSALGDEQHGGETQHYSSSSSSSLQKRSRPAYEEQQL